MEELVGSVTNLFKNKFNVRFIQSCKRESKNGTYKSRLLVITDHRIFFLLKSPLCVEKFFHVIDIKGLECLSTDKLSITSHSKTVVVMSESGFTQTVREILMCLKRIYSSLSASSLLQNMVMPSPKIADTILIELDKMVVNVLPCGHFSAAYRCMCDFFMYPCLEDVVWDVEAIYYLHDSKEFNFRDFDYMDTKYHMPILAALRHNSYFTGLNFSNVKMGQQNVSELAKVLKSNCTLMYLNLSNTSVKTTHIEKLCESISLNPKSSISFLDISKNSLDEKGIINISSLSLNWVGLNLSETCLSQAALLSLFSSLLENSLNFTSLTYLDLSRNVLKKDATASLFSLLSHPNAIEKLILEYCELSLENCFEHLHQGCVENLYELNLSGSQMNKKKLNEGILFKWKDFFSSARSLAVLSLNHCHFTHEALKSILLGLAVNPFMRELELKLSGNSFDSKLMDIFDVSLPLLTKVTSLDISNNNFVGDDFKVLFEKMSQMKALKKLYVGRNLQNLKPKNVEGAVEAIVNYLKHDDLNLECLHLDEMSLKSEMFLFLNHLGGDSHLTELNISSNYIGPAGACLLSKALQINCKLKKIVIDKNDLNMQALQDIAYSLSRNYFLKSISMPFHDIMNIQKANPERTEKLEETIKKIEYCISRNNSPSILLKDKMFASKAYMLQVPLLVDLIKATQNLENVVTETDVSKSFYDQSLIDDARDFLIESHSFIKMYTEYHSSLKTKTSPRREQDDELMKLIKTLSCSAVAYQTDSVQTLMQFLSKTCPKNFELIKGRISLTEVRLQDIVMSPTLAKIMEDSEQTLNVAVPFAALEFLKVISELLSVNLMELAHNLTTSEEEVKLRGNASNKLCKIRENSDYLKIRRSTIKEEIRCLSHNLLETSFMKTARNTRPTSSVFENPCFLYLPVLSDSLEHLNLQRPKAPKKHKPTKAILRIGNDSYNLSVKSPKPLPRIKQSKELKPKARHPSESDA